MNCKVCGQPDPVHLWDAVCGPWYRCLYCGSDTNPKTYAEVKHAYNGNLMTHHYETCGGRDELKRSMTTNFDWFGKFMIPEKTFLDIGALTGVAMEEMRDRGYASYGFDVIPEAAKYDPGTTVAPEFKAQLFPRKFGAILMREVIEHLEDWRDALEEVREAMLTSGLFQIQTPRPTAGCEEMIHQEVHLQIFSPMALERALQEQGFLVIDRMFWPGGQAFMCRR